MTKKMNETGWNFDNSYARLPEIIFFQHQTNPCKCTKVDRS